MSLPVEASILIPTLESPDVDQVVASLLNQTIEKDRYEVIVSDCRPGRWREKLANLPIRYLWQDRPALHRTFAMNTALRVAKGSIVIFLAGDFTPQSDFIARHLAFHERFPALEMAAIGPSRFIPSQSSNAFVQRLEAGGRIFGMDGESGDARGFFYVGNTSLRREFVDRAGGFDEDFLHDALDDHEFGCRLRAAGFQSQYLPEALVWHAHAHAPTLAERTLAMNRAGGSARVLERKHPGSHGWSASCEHAPWRLQASAWLNRCRYRLTRDTQFLQRYYALHLDAAFVRGWKKGRPRVAAGSFH